MRLILSQTGRMQRVPMVALAIGTTWVITLGQPIAAQALNLRDLLPRVLPGLIQTVQLANISDSQEMQLGQQTDRQLTTKQFKILNDRSLNDRVNRIGQRLTANIKRNNLTYTFQVVDDKSINAAATMGGYVYVNKGLIDAAANDAELASVIAHELGHIEARHSIEQAKNSALAQTGAAALKLDQNQLVNIATQIGFNLPRSRRFELDADERGLRLLTAAGYDGRAAISFMQKLDQGSGSNIPRWLSSHPDTQVRVKRLQTYADRLGQSPIATQPVVIGPKPIVIQPPSGNGVIPTDGFVVPTQPMER
jgi:beta-barrel assembly-enhancing protease